MTSLDTMGPRVSVVFENQSFDLRPAPPTSHEIGKKALLDLVEQMHDDPGGVLPRFVELAMELTGGISAGISLLENGHPEPVFRWHHLKGLLAPFDGATTPRNFSPCGITLDRRRPTLAIHPERVYDWIPPELSLPEVLLVPLYIGKTDPLGTLWIVSDKPNYFHGGHSKTMQELATFIGLALKLQRSESELQAALEQQKSELALSQSDFTLSQSDLEISREALLVAKNESELREQFIAVLGHDLRNPLASILSGARILGEELSDPKLARIVRLMNESGQRMNRLIDDLMDLARGRLGGGIAIERISGQRLEPTLAQVINEIRSGRPDIDVDIRFNLDQPVTVDHGRIGQLFSNLLGNAVTHGDPSRPIVVEASIKDNYLELAVANAGPPIPEAAKQHLFQPFYRAQAGADLQGLGLGLYIASQIAKAHRGRLDIKSDRDETRFTFRMPIDF